VAGGIIYQIKTTSLSGPVADSRSTFSNAATTGMNACPWSAIAFGLPYVA